MARHGYLPEYDQAPDGDEGNRHFLLSRAWDGNRERQRGFFGNIRNQARELGAFGGHGGWERSRRGFRSNQDDHYLSWRDKQIEALDRDYAEYCREREQQFHQDFDSWRRKRQQRAAGAGQDELLLTTPRPSSARTTTDGPAGPPAAPELESAAMPGRAHEG